MRSYCLGLHVEDLRVATVLVANVDDQCYIPVVRVINVDDQCGAAVRLSGSPMYELVLRACSGCSQEPVIVTE